MKTEHLQICRSAAGLAMALAFALGLSGTRAESGSLWNVGPLYDHFPLTLFEGAKTEIAGPLYYDHREPERTIWALPPFFSHTRYPAVDGEEMDVLFPLWTYDRFGEQKRWQLFQIFNHSSGTYSDETVRGRLTLFPFYFHQRSTNPDQNYTAVWPLFGRLHRRMLYTDIEFVLWPLYVKTRREGTVAQTPEDEFLGAFYSWREARREDMTTWNVLAPVFHYRTGPGLVGWQAWPLFRWEKQEIGSRTNRWGETQVLPGHYHLNLIWPLFYYQDRRLGTPNEEKFRAFLPLFSSLRSPARDSTSYLWPIGLTLTDDRARKYHEVGAPWPFIVFARGEGKTTDRVWPFYGRSYNDTLESSFVMWPIFKYNAVHAETYDRRRSRILWFLYSNAVEQNMDTGQRRRRVDAWPLFTHRSEMDGRTRLQVFAPLEPFLPNIKSIEQNYSPLWSVWRSEHNPKTEAASQSLLWNLYRNESRTDSRKCSLLFGLFQYQSGAGGKGVRVFYIPFSRPKAVNNTAFAEVHEQPAATD